MQKGKEMMKRIITAATAAIMSLSATVSAMGADTVFKLGANSNVINSVQESLEDKGYKIDDKNGFFGLETLAAIIKFQDSSGLYISGTIDTDTKKALLGESSVQYSEEDLYWLSRIVHAESQGESFQGKLAVANCVLNRVKSDEYPDSIKEVIFDTKYGVQYQPTVNGSIYETPDSDSINAAKDALSGVNPVGDCLFFFNPDTASNFWISENREFYTAIGNHHFYL